MQGSVMVMPPGWSILRHDPAAGGGGGPRIEDGKYEQLASVHFRRVPVGQRDVLQPDTAPADGEGRLPPERGRQPRLSQCVCALRGWGGHAVPAAGHDEGLCAGMVGRSDPGHGQLALRLCDGRAGAGPRGGHAESLPWGQVHRHLLRGAGGAAALLAAGVFAGDHLHLLLHPGEDSSQQPPERSSWTASGACPLRWVAACWR